MRLQPRETLCTGQQQFVILLAMFFEETDSLRTVSAMPSPSVVPFYSLNFELMRVSSRFAVLKVDNDLATGALGQDLRTFSANITGWPWKSQV